MKQFLTVAIWLLALLLGLFLLDRSMTRLTTTSPVLREAQIFYCDFRARLLALPRKPPQLPDSIESLIDKHDKPEPLTAAPPPLRKAPPPPPAANDGFVFADDKGELHFAATLDEVPQRYRAEARPLKK